jgi:hypothetical protein
MQPRLNPDGIAIDRTGITEKPVFRYIGDGTIGERV